MCCRNTSSFYRNLLVPALQEILLRAKEKQIPMRRKENKQLFYNIIAIVLLG